MKKITIILILFALALTACQSNGAKANVESTVEIMKITPSPDQDAMSITVDTGTPSADRAAIVFQRSGGFAGESEQWSLFADGTIIKDYPGQKRPSENRMVEAAQVTALVDAIQAVGFFDMKASSGIGDLSNCKDCYTYTLTVTSNGESNTITIHDGDTGLPDAFWTVIEQINNLITGPTE